MTTNFNFTRKDFFNAIVSNAVIIDELVSMLSNDKREVTANDIDNYCHHALEMLNKEKKVSEKKLAEQAEINQRVLDAIPFDEPIPMTELVVATGYSSQRIASAITRLINNGEKIVRAMVNKKMSYKREA